MAKQKDAKTEQVSIQDRIKQHQVKIDADRWSKGKMKVSFTNVKSIKHVRGLIIVEMDHHSLMQSCLKIASEELGEGASAVEISNLADKLFKERETKAQSVKQFSRNLTMLIQMGAIAPGYVNKDKSGTVVDIVKEGIAAIKEGIAYIRQNPDSFTPDFDFLAEINGDAVPVNQISIKELDKFLGLGTIKDSGLETLCELGVIS